MYQIIECDGVYRRVKKTKQTIQMEIEALKVGLARRENESDIALKDRIVRELNFDALKYRWRNHGIY